MMTDDPNVGKYLPAALFRARFEGEDLKAYQVSTGEPYKCVMCNAALAPVQSEGSGNIEAYRCGCGAEVGAMKVYQDAQWVRKTVEKYKKHDVQTDR